MAWIESHQAVGGHPKTKRLARLLGVSLPAAVGHLHYLWWWALDFAQDGNLSKYDAYDIKDATLWEGDENVMLEALVETGFIDEIDEGLFLHDWEEYAGKLLERRAKDRARKREAADVAKQSGEFRGKSAGKSEEADGSRKDSCVTNQPTNQPKPTNLNQPTNQPEEAAAAAPVPFEKIRELFNSTCLSFSKVIGISGKRQTTVAARWKEHPDLDWWREYFEKIEASGFLKGDNARKWKATFDWLINTSNMNKVLEGLYNREGGENSGRTETAQRDPQQYTRGFKE